MGRMEWSEVKVPTLQLLGVYAYASLYYNIMETSRAMSESHPWWALVKHIWTGAQLTGWVRVMSSSWFWLLNSQLHEAHPVSSIPLWSYAVSTCEGAQLNEHMTLRDLRKSDVQFFLRKIGRQFSSNHSMSNVPTASQIITNIVVWSTLNPFEKCGWKYCYLVKWCVSDFDSHLKT